MTSETSYDRIFQIPEKGKDASYVLTQILLAADDSEARYDKKQACSKPGTLPDPLTLFARDLAELKTNPNGVDGEMFPGSYNREKDVISMTARMFGKNANNPNLDAGLLLSGGTESLNQVLWMLRNKFFMERYGEDIRKEGGRVYANIAQKNGEVPHPKILSPINYHFTNLKAADLLGLGSNVIANYGLDEKYDADLSSLEMTVRNIYESGNDIIANLAVAGDTTKGKVHDIDKITELLETLAKEYGKEAPSTVVDAAGSYLFIGTMHDNPNYDGNLPRISFQNKDIEALIGDPHKQQMPYSSGMLLLKDYKLFQFSDVSKFSNYIDAQNGAKSGLDVLSDEGRRMTNALSTIPTSRSGSNAFAIWAYYVSKGLEGIRGHKEKIWGLVKDFRDFIKDSKYFELVTEPQTQIVPFRFRGEGKHNIEIYKNIKMDKSNYYYISEDEGMIARTPEQLRETYGADYDKKYTGLFVTIMEHNTQDGMDSLKERLEEEARTLSK